MRRIPSISLLLMAVLIGACASSGQSSGTRSRDRNVITADELAELSVSTAFDAVRRLRPSWLRSRGRSGVPAVYRNNARWGDSPNSLESIQITSIREIRYLNASDATTRWGTGVPGGVIQVLTR